MKRILTVVLSLAIVLSMAASALAQPQKKD